MNNKEIILYQKEIERKISEIQVVKIRNASDLLLTQESLAKISAAQKLVKAKKDTIVKPLMEALKNTRALFGVFELKLTQMESAVKTELGEYRKRMEAKAEKRIEQIEAKTENGEMEFIKAGAKIAAIQDNINSIARIRKVREVIVDDESKIPDEYWIIDMVKLRKDALAGVKVAGVRIIEKEIITK